ncbi:MAG TPA: cytochrome-c oxidase, cbb3-type subunit I [Myxococcaceae bacterium]|nr:cytochrome-c oxidase, cbb3-type subunit I [Myxococcaceae bacterium]
MEQRVITYDDTTVRRFIFAAVVFGAVAMLVGAIIATQMVWWQANLGVPYLVFSRLRPLHTNAAIFAFVGNSMFAGVYYSTQRLCKVRMASDLLSKIHFWGWQLIIVAAAVTLPLGITTSKEYAELEWPIDVAITLVWVVFAINFFWTLARRNEKNLYVALWFYIATIVTIAVLHIVNSLEIPVTLTKSYSIFAGVQDALVQWWYGHNAVAFFLTTPILGIMYYFMPKAAERPVYSYRLSIVHFWSLVFMYIWAGPHHLLHTALPDWAQSLGMVFSVALWAPSWGGLINGMLTLRGAWDKLRTDPVIKFLVAALTFYGMSTFEGPLLSIKSVNALAHYTDWIISHVHSGALGWNGFMAAGTFYWMVPRLFGTKLYSKKAAELHFWMATAGIILYVVALWVAGVSQGLMWRAQTPDGALAYPSFVETILAIRPLWMVRLLGGLLYLSGFLLMAWNLGKTALAGKAVNGQVTVTVEEPHRVTEPSAGWLVTRPGFLFVLGAVVLSFFLGGASMMTGVKVLVVLVILGEVAWLWFKARPRDPAAPGWHQLVEGKPLFFTVLLLVAVLAGGIAQLIPTIFAPSAVPWTGEKQQPYSPLELAGRDVYTREGCYVCHSQMIRTLQGDTQRYGAYSRPEEFIVDHPFQWGSKRTGPDLHREGGKYPNLWHYSHMMDPRSTSPGSNMPSFAWTADYKVDQTLLSRKMIALQKVGVPYSNIQVDLARDTYRKQAESIVVDLAKEGVAVPWDREIVALIAYLQRLGRGPQAPGPLPTAAAPITNQGAR